MQINIYKKIFRDVGIIGIADLISTFNGILLIPIITKILGAEDYGLFVQFIVTITLITGFSTLGLPYTTVRFLAGEKDTERICDDLYSTFGLIALASVVISILILLMSNQISEILFDGEKILVLLIAILIPIESLNGSFQNVFRVFQNIKSYTIFTIARNLVETLASIIVVLSGFGIIQVAITIVLIRAMTMAILLITTVRSVGFQRPTFTRMRDYLKFGLPTIPSNIAAWVTNSSDRYIISFFLGIIYVGYYNPAYALGSMIQIFMTPVNFVLVAVVSKIYEENNLDLLRDIFKYSIKYFLMISIPAFFGLSLLSRPILTVLTTPEIADQSYLVTPFIAFSMLLTGIGGVATGLSLYLAKRTDISMINWMIVATTNIILNMLLVPRWGIVGAAAATMAAFIVGFIFGGYYAFKYFKFAIDWKSIIKAITSSLVMSVAIVFNFPTNLIEIVLVISLGFLIYFASMILLKAISIDEIKNIRTLVIGHNEVES
jgi:O-antigen/teichoic acid export membrane protein